MRSDAVRRLVEHDRAPLAGELGEPLRPCPTRSRQEALEHEPRRRAARSRRARRRAPPGRGRSSRRSRRRATARTSRSPGSLMPGVPASVTTATSPPVAEHRRAPRRMRAASVCSLQTASRAPRTPACCSSRPVRRVSSQQISAASASAVDRPRRQVAEVADRAWRRAPAGRRPRHAQPPGSRWSRRPVAELDASPIDRPHRSNAPASASITHAALGTGSPMRCRRHAHHLDDDAVARRRTRRRAGSASRWCAPTGTLAARSPRRGRRAGAARDGGSGRSDATSAEARTRASLTSQATAEAWHAARGPDPPPPGDQEGDRWLATVPPRAASPAIAPPRRRDIRGYRVPGSILGNRVVRKEDPKFLTTGGEYLDDLNDVPELAGAAYVAYVRSTVAHGTITSIDTDRGDGDAGRRRRVHRRRPRRSSRCRRRSTRPSPARCWPATASATSASRSPPSSPRRASRPPTPPRP